MKYWLVLLICALAHTVQAEEVPQARLVTLSRGVNLIDIEKKSVEALRTEIEDVHRAGFRHVRFFFDPAWVWQSGEPQRLDQILRAAFAVHLGVIICMHSYVDPLKDNPQQLARWTTAWQKIASHYATSNPDQLFFELVNEPPFPPDRWTAIQEGLRQTVRAIVPHHTLLLTGSPTSTSYALADLSPSPDENVAYVFHIYAPMVFTHQGADWADPAFGTIHGLQYPPNATNLAKVVHAAAPKVREDIERYGKVGTGVIPQDVKPALDWASRNHVHLVVTEFGVYRPVAPFQSRISWLRDTRSILELYGIGWSVWEYNGGFGIKPELDLGCGPLPIALGLCHQ